MKIGIIVGLLSTCIQSIGLTLQRKSHLLEDEKEDEDVRRPPYRRRRWQLGMFMFIVSNLVGSTIQITTLPLPVLSTLQASGLVFNTICASIILKEPFTRWSFIGTALVAAGALLIAMFGALAEPSHTLKQLLDLLQREQFILWMLGTFAMIAAILVSIFILNRIHPHSQSHGLRVYKGFAFGGISSILSAHSLLVAKSAVELLVRTIIDHKNQFDRWQSWMILLLLVFFALTQLYFLHRGLKLVSTSILYPFVFCIYNIIAILDGLIYFHQTSRLSALHAGLIAVGTAVLLSGVLFLSWRISEESKTAPPADVNTLLTPGMGIVEDTTTEDERGTDIDDDNASVTSADEEASIMHPTEATPLLPNGRNLSLKERQDAILRVTKNRRNRTNNQTEDAEILEELLDSAHDADWNLADDQPPRRASIAFDTRTRTGAASPSKPHTRAPKHKRVRSDDISAPTAASMARDSSSSPPPPKAGISRARTVHGSSVSFAPLAHTMTWRERDRERRRRAWSRSLHLPGTSGSRGRSVSAPQGRRTSVQRQLRESSGSYGAMGGGDSGAGASADEARGAVEEDPRAGPGALAWLASFFRKKDHEDR